MIIEAGSGAAVLADQYTRELGDYAKKQLPVTLNNDEYLSRISAMIVALNRMLAEYVVTSCHVHNVAVEQMMSEVISPQFDRNVQHALAAIQGEGSTVQ